MTDFVNEIDIYQYFGKGGVQKFKKEFGMGTFQKIHGFTSILDNGSFNNRKFTARLLFIKKYNCNINNITKNGKIFMFNGDDFILTSKNSTEKQWDDTNCKLNKITDTYTYEETVELLMVKELYKTYFGKSGNRKMIRDNPKLYKSIYEHTLFLNNEDKLKRNFTFRILFLINKITNLSCCVCNSKKTWRKKNFILDFYCYPCTPKFPEKEWFILKYGNKGEIKYSQYIDRIKSLKSNSLEWYVHKYGEKGKLLYHERYQRQQITINELKNNRYSSISQELFKEIKNQLPDLEDLYFQEHNQEYFIRLPISNKLNQTILFLDFKYKDKVIEYHGEYWHNQETDEIRKNLLEEMGYKYLTIYSSDYNKNSKSKKIIDKCVNFLINED